MDSTEGRAMRHLNVTIANELHKRHRVSCTLEGKKVVDVVRQLVERQVQEVEKRKLIGLNSTMESLLCGVSCLRRRPLSRHQ